MRNDQFEIRPLTPGIGAEIRRGFVYAADATHERIHALLDHLVVFFRDQQMSPDQHVAGRRFGDLHIHPSAPCVDGRPELMEIHAIGPPLCRRHRVAHRRQLR